jgi:2-polyprenyl-3-methyl-5-hydroxy-6-metoxy-1,4-benzoquinol methylase
MPTNHLFYEYYDTLYADKNYKEETDYLFSIAELYLTKPPEKILEIGCGTGNHTLEIAKHGLPVTAIDIDHSMAEIAKIKIKKTGLNYVKVEQTEIEKLKDKGFDIALAMFNVITYIQDLKSLLSFFIGIHQRLDKDGLFIFDCWNGSAALLDPPKNKTIAKKTRSEDISCKIVSDTNFLEQKTTLNYYINVRSILDNTQRSDLFTFAQTLWTPLQIWYNLKKSGFEIIKCSKLFNIEEQATPTDWKIMFVCQKIK